MQLDLQHVNLQHVNSAVNHCTSDCSACFVLSATSEFSYLLKISCQAICFELLYLLQVNPATCFKYLVTLQCSITMSAKCFTTLAMLNCFCMACDMSTTRIVDEEHEAIIETLKVSLSDEDSEHSKLLLAGGHISVKVLHSAVNGQALHNDASKGINHLLTKPASVTAV